MVSKVKIKIKDLYKIFGPSGESHVERVKSGVGKTELLEKHSHVLGLQDINLDIIEGKIQVIMGLSGSGKVYTNTTYKSFNRTHCRSNLY
jgi:glycine betaine/proline transport system ATP-binding protein